MKPAGAFILALVLVPGCLFPAPKDNVAGTVAPPVPTIPSDTYARTEPAEEAVLTVGAPAGWYAARFTIQAGENTSSDRPVAFEWTWSSHCGPRSNATMPGGEAFAMWSSEDPGPQPKIAYFWNAVDVPVDAEAGYGPTRLALRNAYFDYVYPPNGSNGTSKMTGSINASSEIRFISWHFCPETRGSEANLHVEGPWKSAEVELLPISDGGLGAVSSTFFLQTSETTVVRDAVREWRPGGNRNLVFFSRWLGPNEGHVDGLPTLTLTYDGKTLIERPFQNGPPVFLPVGPAGLRLDVPRITYVGGHFFFWAFLIDELPPPGLSAGADA